MIVFSPMNEKELRDIMFTVSQDDFKSLKNCISIRYPRGEGVMPMWRTAFEKIEIGKGRKIKDGEKVAILTLGHIGNYATKACQLLESEGINPAHYDMRFVKPLDEQMLHEIFQCYDKVVTVEDGCIQGGFGSAVAEFMLDHDYTAQIKRLGIPDKIVEHGEQLELHHECGFDPEGIAEAVRKLLGTEKIQKKSEPVTLTLN
jgi:1-deoxy-D-xylulose-5-phosphate synthase